MKIEKLLTPHNFREGRSERIEYIVIHYVGALGGAEANCKYYASEYRGSSAHYFVGHAGEVWQSVEDKNVAWHCGGQKYANTDGGLFHGKCTNANSIGIEMCVRKDAAGNWYFEKETIASTIELTKALMKRYGVPVERVIRHYDVTGKICPEPYVRYRCAWEEFLLALIRDVNGWQKLPEGLWAYFENGEPVKEEWRLINHHWYYFDASGIMLTDWQKINDQWFYLEKSGEYEGACWHESDKNNGELERWYVG